MGHKIWGLGSVLAAGVLGLLVGGAGAQTVRMETRVDFGRATHLVVPQARGFALQPSRVEVGVESVTARVEILGRAARTRLEIEVRNPGGAPAEAVLLLPVPARAAVSAFDFEGAGAESSARLLPADEARRTYEGIVAQLRDPALLEFAGHDLVRSSVFPVPANGRQRVRLTYEHVLDGGPGRVDYVLPRSESLARRAPWHVSVDVRGERPLSTVYSPTHEIVARRSAPERFSVRVDARSELQPGPFRLAVVHEDGPVSASLYAYPDPSAGGGYVLLVAGLPSRKAELERRVRREVTLVIDRSGSMAGVKLDQARTAARGVIEALDSGESFQIVDYAAQVSTFAPRPVQVGPESLEAARAYLDALRPLGGTNLHDALVEALRPEPTAGSLPIVLFLTDGLPTVGRTSETEIAAAAESANVHRRRVFTFGVGADVNVPLLDRLSDATRATSTFVAPGEDVEVAVAAVFQKLYGPVLANVELARAADVSAGQRELRDVVPPRLPDLYEGDSLVVLARYVGDGPLRLTLRGELFGEAHEVPLAFTLEGATTRNAFVPRLWASRQIAYLVDEVRQAGSDRALAGTDPFSQPRLRELRDEILRLSTQFGVLTEHTAFLALEGSRLDDWGQLVTACGNSLRDKAVAQRTGIEALGQGRNFNQQKLQSVLNQSNRQWNEQLESVAFGTVQQVADRAFYARGGRWIDSRLVADPAGLEPDAVVVIGTPAHRQLVEELLLQGREACVALEGEVLLEHGTRKVLVQNRIAAGAAAPAAEVVPLQGGSLASDSDSRIQGPAPLLREQPPVSPQGGPFTGQGATALELLSPPAADPASGSTIELERQLPSEGPRSAAGQAAVPNRSVPLEPNRTPEGMGGPQAPGLRVLRPNESAPERVIGVETVPLQSASTWESALTPPPQNFEEPRPVDLAICLDTSGSMRGLIDSARQKLWEIVNDLALLQPQPRLRVALLTFGNNTHAPENGWVQVQTDLTQDLDRVSELLFALSTNGGTEYVGRVVDHAVRGLSWSAGGLQMIVVAGNESAEQDPQVDLRAACGRAIERGIVVNSIYCGAPTDELAAAWREVARLAEGHYAAIDQQRGTLAIPTPFDAELATLSKRLNETYIPVGAQGRVGWANQAMQDANVHGLNASAGAERANTKASGLYVCSWDLVDASAQADFDLAAVSKHDLPERLRELSLEALREHVAASAGRRTEMRSEIQRLDARRQEFLLEARARAARAPHGLHDALREAIREQAAARGFRRPSPAREPAAAPAEVLER